MMIAAVMVIAALAQEGSAPPAPQGGQAHLPVTTQLPAVQPRQGIEPTSALDLIDSFHDFRQDAASKGITFNANLTLDGGYNFSGGERAGGFVVGLATGAVQLETEKLLDWKGGTFLVRWQSYFQTNPEPYQLVPDYWGFESIASGIGDLNQLSECYYQQSLLEDRLAVRFGKQDASDIFLNPLGESTYFITNSGSYPATMVPYLPTYPDQAMGLVISGSPSDWLDLKFGWFDGYSAYSTSGAPPQSTGSLGPGTFFDNPGSWFFITEADLTWQFSGGLDGTVGVGGWWQTGPSVAGGPNVPQPFLVSDLSAGWYAQVAQRIFNPDPSGNSQRGVQVFGQFGWGDPTTNPVQWSVGTGVVWNGPIPNREDDSVGVALGWASFSDNAATYSATPGLYECTIECYYNIALTSWMSLQPDMQVVISPMGNSEMPAAVLGILRLSINF